MKNLFFNVVKGGKITSHTCLLQKVALLEAEQVQESPCCADNIA
jgi:hypothetical protein